MNKIDLFNFHTFSQKLLVSKDITLRGSLIIMGCEYFLNLVLEFLFEFIDRYKLRCFLINMLLILGWNYFFFVVSLS